jgi:hypothetical protein
MSYAALPTEFQSNVSPYRGAPATEATPRPGFLVRLFNAVFESRQRQAERDIEDYLARTGHRFTDSIEREINEHYFNGSWNVRR